MHIDINVHIPARDVRRWSGALEAIIIDFATLVAADPEAFISMATQQFAGGFNFGERAGMGAAARNDESDPVATDVAAALVWDWLRRAADKYDGYFHPSEETIDGWTQAQRCEAFAWADAVLSEAYSPSPPPPAWMVADDVPE